MSFIKMPLAAYRRIRFPPAARDLYALLRGLLYVKTGGYDDDLETSGEELSDWLQISIRQVWRRLNRAEEAGLIERIEGDAPLTIQILQPWLSGQAAHCDTSVTPSSNTSPDEVLASAPAGTSRAPATPTTPPATQTGPSPATTDHDGSVIPDTSVSLLKSGGVDPSPDPDEDHHHQVLKETDTNVSDTNVTAQNVLEIYLDNDDVARELAKTCTLAQVQRAIVLIQREAGRNQRMENPKGILVTRLREGRYADAREIPPELWIEYEEAGYQDWLHRLAYYID